MEALILNREFQTQCILDMFESFIWTERYSEAGDFEIYMPVNKKYLEFMNIEYYIWRSGTDRLMIIENISIETNAEDGDHITLSGRSLESILDRRVVATRFVYTGNIEEGLEKLLNENLISPEDPERKIPNFRFVYSKNSKIEAMDCDLNLLGEDLLTVVKGLCEENNIGFKVIYNEEEETMDFSLYNGEDRSYDQEDNPWVAFTPKYENLTGSNYYETRTELKTAAVVAGDPNYEKGQVVLDVNEKPKVIGLDRREMFVDASDIELPDPQVNEEAIYERYKKFPGNRAGKEIEAAWARAEAQTTAVYYDQLRQRAREELSKTYITKSFDGTIEGVRQYVYDRDFFLGDIVQVSDSYGKEASSRITEVVMTHDVNGESIIPTFMTLIGGANEGDINGGDSAPDE